MATTALKGNPVNTNGELPSMGQKAPSFKLAGADLSDVTSEEYAGKRMVLNIFPSIETGICSASVRKFNELAGNLDNTVVLCISKDLPFTLKKFCGAEGLERVIPLSDFRGYGFDEDYGVRMMEGGMKGLLARSIVVLDENGVVIHSQLVPEIGTEPDYDSAISVL